MGCLLGDRQTIPEMAGGTTYYLCIMGRIELFLLVAPVATETHLYPATGSEI
jgi:hypothetical protein